MSWYAASVVVFVKYEDGNQNEYPLWENVVLVEASSDDEAYRKAEDIGKETDGDEFTWEDRPAFWCFAGIRKMLSIDTENGGALEGGTEITFSQMTVNSESDLDKFVDGKEVNVLYER